MVELPDLAREDLLRRIGRLDQVGGVRAIELADGRGRGIRVLEFRAGKLSFDVLVDRCFDLGRCDFAGVPVAWLSPAGHVGPWYAEPEGFGWLRTFGGGLLATCGLDHTQGPGEDAVDHLYTPDLPTRTFGLHGRVGMLPARLVGYGTRWDGDRCVLWASGEVEQASAFAEELVLRRTVEADLGGATIRVRDEVENVGHVRSTHMLLYHVNVGWPIVDEGSEIVLAATEIRAVDGREPGNFLRIGPPEARAQERVFELALAGAPRGTARAGIVNQRLGLGFAERFRLVELPRFNIWRMLGEDMYAIGLEPATNRDAGRWDAREREELLTLEPGQLRRYQLDLEVLVGAEELGALKADVATARRANRVQIGEREPGPTVLSPLNTRARG